MAAPLHVPLSFSDDEPIVFALGFDQSDGTPYPLNDVSIEFVVRDAAGAEALRLTDAAGITKDPTTGNVQWDGGALRLAPGRYTHGCRFVTIATGKPLQVWTGPLNIYEGGF